MDKQQEQITLLQGALSSAIDDLADIGQAFCGLDVCITPVMFGGVAWKTLA